MTAEQRKFVDEVILPKLVNMAIDCTLPIDMNELSSFDFDEEAEKFNAENPEVRKICYWTLADVEHVVNEQNEWKENEENYTPIEYTDDLGHAVLDNVEDVFDANYGVCWDTLRNSLETMISIRNGE